MKNFIKVFLLSLFISFSYGGVVNAQPLPLHENEAIIQEQQEILETKAVVLEKTNSDLEQLEEKKTTLATELDTIKQDIAELEAKVADKKAKAEAERKRLEELKNMFVYVDRYAGNSAGNTYAPGNCTWYAKSMRPDLPNSLGNANTWYYRAQSLGWNVGSAPKKGAVATSTRGYYGHVAYVTGVSLDGQQVTIREMNYGGLYSMNTRTVHYSEFKYIYELN